MKKRYHIDIDRKMARGAKIALLPGDPGRSSVIADMVAEAYSGQSTRLASKREFITYLVEASGHKVLVTSTGIGGPSTSIAIDELAQIGIRTFIRVGTTGAIQRRIRTGDVVITTGSVRLDGASTHYAPIEYPAVADFSVVSALVKGAKAVGVSYHTGVTASSDTFYPGEERKDSYTGYVLRRFQGATDEWRALNVLNYEMESSTVLTLTASMGLRGGCVTGVVNRGSTGTISKGSLKAGEDSAIRTAVAALAFLDLDA